MKQSLESSCISGNGSFTKKCESFFKRKLGVKKVLLTKSCTDALPSHDKRFDGIEPANLDKKKAEDPSVPYQEKFSLITTVEEVTKRLKDSLFLYKE